MLLDLANARKNSIQNPVVANRGKPEAFTDTENRALRRILRSQYAYLRKHKKVRNQAEMGSLLKISQQSAARLMGTSQAGFSRPTALELARICGFDSPETLLRELGADARVDEAPRGWALRDLAVRNARSIGYEEAVLDRVVAKFADAQYAWMSARWWNERIVAEQAERDAMLAIPAPPPSETAATAAGASLPKTTQSTTPRRKKAR